MTIREHRERRCFETVFLPWLSGEPQWFSSILWTLRPTAQVNARCTAIPPAGSRRVACASSRARRRVCGLPHRARVPALLFRFTTRPGPRRARRRVTPSAVLRERSTSAEHSCGPQWIRSKLQAFLTDAATSTSCGFEAYCFPASPDPQVVVFDPEMDLEYTLPRASINDQRTLARQRARPLTRNPTSSE
ncbi:hypothetical protein EVAR_88461_1 [Eumeta japonica]|uniref:Uncharacterized protein n=1 Tax=Eumeta variegata TaxID=151549 RepID=A0A4C1XR58_EUMVA|nr:hypothetical protein EVAR_88461_1 [Eumeta japonica]